MFHNILGFGGRMGRLEFFLISIVFGFFMGLLILALFLGFTPRGATASEARAALESPGLRLILLLGVLPIWLWFSLAFQAKRFRDIGWNPLYIIPGWFVASLIDQLVSIFFPTLALLPGQGTWLGLLLDLFLIGSLLFWPSAPTGTGDWSGGSHVFGAPDPEPQRGRPRAAIPTPRPAAPTWSPAPAPVSSGFGRRGL